MNEYDQSLDAALPALAEALGVPLLDDDLDDD